MIKSRIFNKYITTILPIAIAVLLLSMALIYNFLIFHITVELFTIIVAAGIFLFSWNTRGISKNTFFNFIGIAFLSIGFITFLHTLAYKGMNLFPGYDANLPTQLWIIERYLLAFSFLFVVIFVNKKLPFLPIITSYFIIIVLAFLSTFVWRNFPTSYVEGKGLTDFKIYSEYLISLILILATYLLHKKREYFGDRIYILLIASLILNILSELFFSFYISVTDIFNILGHTFKMIAYIMIYIAIIEIGLTQPYQIIFRELRKTSKLKDEFMNIASHELKTPITSTKLYLQLLKRQSKKDEKSKILIGKIDKQVDKMTNLINILLDVSRIETGRISLNMEVINLSKLAKNTLTEMQKMADKHKMVFIGPKTLYLKADRLRIGQVIANLLTNAARYSPKHSIITLKVKKRGDTAIVSIKDQGVGIEPDHQKKLFSKYYQIERKDKSEGLGLGLYISKEIIEAHGGSIWLKSAPDKGSTFCFSLPIIKQDDNET